MKISQRTDKGSIRTENQDSLIIGRELYGVADGMGGHNGGETASRVASRVLCSTLKHRKPDIDQLRQAVEAANKRVYQMQLGEPALRGMGTTVSVLWNGKHSVLIAQVGDSRVYLLRDGVLKQLTQDHSYVQELVKAGVITEAEAFFHPNRNIITRAVGSEEEVQVDVQEVEKQPGDLFLICSDGLSGMVTHEAMEQILNAAGDDDESAADALLASALGAGGTDNISLVLCREEARSC